MQYAMVSRVIITLEYSNPQSKLLCNGINLQAKDQQSCGTTTGYLWVMIVVHTSV